MWAQFAQLFFFFWERDLNWSNVRNTRFDLMCHQNYYLNYKSVPRIIYHGLVTNTIINQIVLLFSCLSNFFPSGSLPVENKPSCTYVAHV